jgi:hypothetical protein
VIPGAIDQRLTQMQNSFFARGTVTAINGAEVTVTTRGGSLQMPKLATYVPTVGDSVEIAWPPGRPYVLGVLG